MYDVKELVGMNYGNLCSHKRNLRKSRLENRALLESMIIPVAVNMVDPAGKASCVYSCMQTKLMGQYIKMTH